MKRRGFFRRAMLAAAGVWFWTRGVGAAAAADCTVGRVVHVGENLTFVDGLLYATQKPLQSLSRQSTAAELRQAFLETARLLERELSAELTEPQAAAVRQVASVFTCLFSLLAREQPSNRRP